MNEVYRKEKKFLINMQEKKKYIAWLEKIMVQDKHNGVDGYNIRSLYFDTINDTDYEGDDYIQIQCWSHYYIIGINLVDNKLFTYDYREWDDGDCSEIIELDEYDLKF